MTKLLDLVLSGAVTGAIYSLMASGMVLTYTTSGIFNFAQGGIAFVVAYLYYQLHAGGLPIVPAVVLSVLVFAPLLGLALDRLVLRRLSKAPVYARIVGTIGLLVALPSLMQWVVVTVLDNVVHLHLIANAAINQGAVVPGVGPTPAKLIHLLRGVVLNTDQLAVLAAAVLVAACLWFTLRHTRVGLETRAVVDRESLAGLRGINATRTSALAWVLSMMVAGLGGVLIAPLFDLDPSVITLVVLGSLAAVVLGGLRSLPIAFVGGLALGVTQDLIAGYVNVLPSWTGIPNLVGFESAVPYLLVLVLGLVVGRDRTRQAGSVSDEIAPIDHRRGMSALRRRLPWSIFIIGLVAYSMQWIPGFQATPYGQTLIAQSLAVGIIFLSFVVVTGIGGMVSLAQATFATAGGFAAGWALTRNWGINLPLIAAHGQLNFFWAVALGSIAAAAVGAIVALPATRLGAVYLALWSLSAAFFFSLVPFAINSIGQGTLGWTIRAPTLDLAGLNWLHHLLTRESGGFNFNNLPDQILLFLGVFGLVTLLIHCLTRSASGRAMLAVRSSQVAATASGVRADRTKILIFALSAGIAGLGGVMLSLFSFTASNSTAPPLVGLTWLALAVLFGVRRPGGALLAGLAFAAGSAGLHTVAMKLPGHTVDTLLTSVYFVPILSGSGAIQLAMEPDGILALVGKRRLNKRLARQRKGRIAVAEQIIHGGVIPEHERLHEHASPEERPTDATLVLNGIVAGYGEVEVLHGVTIVLEAGTIVSLLGANGAGKSTLCSVAAGLVAPAYGTVVFKGIDLTASPSYQRARAGLLLVPESRGVFPGLTVAENLTISLRTAEDRDKAYARFPVLAERRLQTAGLLSGGEQQMLSLASALANPPAVFLADEPTLGLAPLAAEEVIRAILELRDRGTAVLLVEESAQHALRFADSIVFMDLGTITWTGPPDDIGVEQLNAAYLGQANI